MGLYSELKRRRVLRVVGAYGLLAWFFIEVAATVFPLLGYDDSAAAIVLYLAIAGFPIAVVLAWVFDITPTGIQRTPPWQRLSGVSGDVPHAAHPATAQHAAAHPAAGQHAGVHSATQPGGDGGAVAHPIGSARTVLGSARAAGFLGLGMIIAIVGVAAYHVYHPLDSGSAAARIESVAVLPFADLSPDGDQAYFSDGIAEELLNRLAMIDGLRVAARTSSFAFRGSAEPVDEIGRRLRVEAVLEGSVRRDGDRVRIVAQLIDARSGFQIWSRTYQRDVASVLAVQDEIAADIIDALRVRLGAVPAPRSGTGHAAALDAYLSGLARLHEGSDTALRAALDDFQRAIAADPEYALAHAALAQTYAVLPAVGDYPGGEAASRGFAAVARAIALDAMLPEANAALGMLAQNFEWDFDAAESAYRRALAANPQYAPAHRHYAETLLIRGRYDEAEREVDQALGLDPLSPAALATKALILHARGADERAFGVWAELARVAPAYRRGHLMHGFAALASDRPAEAGAAFDRAFAGQPPAWESAAQLVAAIADGDASAARRAIEGLRSALPPSFVALACATVGEAECARAAVADAAREQLDPNLPLLLRHRGFDAVRADPGFSAATAAVLAKA